MSPTIKEIELRTTIKLLLDQVDYVAGNCKPTEQVGAVLPKIIIEVARDALKPTE